MDFSGTRTENLPIHKPKHQSMPDQVQSLLSIALLIKFLMASWIALTLRSLTFTGRGSLLPVSLLCVGGSTAAAIILYDARSAILGCSAAIALFTAFLYQRAATPNVANFDASFSTRNVLLVASLIGLGLSTGGLVKSIPEISEAPVVAWFLLAANCVGLACAILFSIELTFYLSPQDIGTEKAKVRNLQYVSIASLIALALATASLTGVFLTDGPRSGFDGGLMREEFRLIAWLFAGTILMLHFVLWMSIRRALVVGAQPGELTKNQRKLSRQWSSLAIAGWIAMSALLVSLATPTQWPWLVQASSDALIGEILKD